MKRELVRRSISTLKLGANVRSAMGDESEIRALWRAYRKRPVHPIAIKPDGTVIDGYRRLNGAYLEGDADAEVDCIVIDGDPSPDEVRRLQFLSALHRSDISLHDKCVFMLACRNANPDKTLAAIADELEMDATMPSKLLVYEKCIDPVKEQIKAGRIGLRDMIAIGGLAPDEQMALLARKLAGATADELGRQSRRRRCQAPAVRAAKIRCPLPSGVTVQVAGEGVSLEDAIEALAEAAKLAKAALAKGLNASTAQRVWRETAVAG